MMELREKTLFCHAKPKHVLATATIAVAAERCKAGLKKEGHHRWGSVTDGLAEQP